MDFIVYFRYGVVQNGNTALMFAAKVGATDVARELLDYGADIKILNNVIVTLVTSLGGCFIG